MNVLGYVAFFLLLLSFLTVQMHNSTLLAKRLELGHLHYLTLSRKVYNAFESKQFSLIQEKKPNSSLPKQKKKPPKKLDDRPHCAKVNLWPLFMGEDEVAYAFLEALFEELYQDHFPTAKARRKFIDRLIASGKKAYEEKRDEPLHLGQIAFKEEEDRLLYYFLLKGDLPLSDFVKIEHVTDKVCLACASYPTLHAFFGKRVAQKLDVEREHPLDRLTISQDKLSFLLNQERISLEVNVWNHLCYKHPRRKKNHITLKEKEKGLTLTKEVMMGPPHKPSPNKGKQP